MKRLVLLSTLLCLAVWAGPKQRAWQDANVAKIERSVSESDSVIYTPSPTTGVANSGVETRRTKTWIYAFQAGRQLYVGKAGRKALPGVHEGDQIRIAVHGDVLYALTPDGKERRLELLTP